MEGSLFEFKMVASEVEGFRVEDWVCIDYTDRHEDERARDIGNMTGSQRPWVKSRWQKSLSGTVTKAQPVLTAPGEISSERGGSVNAVSRILGLYISSQGQ